MRAEARISQVAAEQRALESLQQTRAAIADAAVMRKGLIESELVLGAAANPRASPRLTKAVAQMACGCERATLRPLAACCISRWRMRSVCGWPCVTSDLLPCGTPTRTTC